MISTLTLNPSLDYLMKLEDFHPGAVNRSRKEQIYPGGKGINVSLLLAQLGVASSALGFLAGFSGREIQDRLSSPLIRPQFIELKEGLSRINVKFSDNQKETEINASGPEIPQEAYNALLQQLGRLPSGSILVLAGSIPPSLDSNCYTEILQQTEGKGILPVVDTSGPALSAALSYRPFLIKPNHHELGELFGRSLTRPAEALPYARELQTQGARNVLVSFAGEGAFLLDESGALHTAAAPKGVVRNSVGAGDSMVAGFLAGWRETADYESAFRMAVAAGSASAFSEWMASEEDIRRLSEQVVIRCE